MLNFFSLSFQQPRQLRGTPLLSTHPHTGRTPHHGHTLPFGYFPPGDIGKDPSSTILVFAQPRFAKQSEMARTRRNWTSAEDELLRRAVRKGEREGKGFFLMFHVPCYTYSPPPPFQAVDNTCNMTCHFFLLQFFFRSMIFYVWMANMSYHLQQPRRSIDPFFGGSWPRPSRAGPTKTVVGGGGTASPRATPKGRGQKKKTSVSRRRSRDTAPTGHWCLVRSSRGARISARATGATSWTPASTTATGTNKRLARSSYRSS